MGSGSLVMRSRNRDPILPSRYALTMSQALMQQQQAALGAARIVLMQDGYIQKTTYSLLAGQAVYDGGAAYFDTGSYGTVTGTPSATTRFIGKFFMPPASSGSAQNVGVILRSEILVSWWDSVTGANKVTAANMFAPVYWADNHTLSTSAGDGPIGGRVVGFAPVGYPLGVGICGYSADALL